MENAPRPTLFAPASIPDRRAVLTGAAGALLAGPALAQAPRPSVWRFDNLKRLGGLPIELIGSPDFAAGPFGRAVGFDGVGDGILVPQHPLAGAAAFTIEAVIRPDGGATEQRWLHLAEDPALPASADVSGGRG
ncbi:hypothetical protein [Phenylobacterium sp. J367]|uniref:hypothetical protein n=1 Tax=Phenylobacterium sp. J367 TaxID=2898435 RepID=UPI002151CC03|nr:hypothetical protein [Phenylobacterium sp. J367]MCR5877255.1 hypothetical protein [Phenylobacterium sp. J367]